MQHTNSPYLAREITAQEIFQRLRALETKVDRIDESTQDVVKAFDSAKGAFVVLDFIGKLAKPVLWVIGVGSAISFLWSEWLRR